MSKKEVICQLLTDPGEVSEAALKDLCRSVLEDLMRESDPNRLMDAAATLFFLVGIAAEAKDVAMPPSWRARLLRAWCMYTKVTSGELRSDNFPKFVKGAFPPPVLEKGWQDNLAFLLTLNIACVCESSYDISSIEMNKAVHFFDELRLRFGFTKQPG